MSSRAQQPGVSNEGDCLSVLRSGAHDKAGRSPQPSGVVRDVEDHAAGAPVPRRQCRLGVALLLARDLQLNCAGGNPDASGYSRSCRRWRGCCGRRPRTLTVHRPDGGRQRYKLLGLAGDHDGVGPPSGRILCGHHRLDDGRAHRQRHYAIPINVAVQQQVNCGVRIVRQSYDRHDVHVMLHCCGEVEDRRVKSRRKRDLANVQALEPNIGLRLPFNLHDVLHPRLAVLRQNSNRDDINPNDKIDLTSLRSSICVGRCDADRGTGSG